MTKEKRVRYSAYQSIPNRARFWVHSETCYTEEELDQRKLILKNRASSKIHPDYLVSPYSWFNEDSQALINIYESSWFYSNAYKPKQTLTRNDFHVQPVNSQRLQWPTLYHLMQKTGDYLLLRNKNLRQEHLNQPMNFFLLDLNNILKGLSQNAHIKQTQEQLEHLTRYVRSIETYTSPFIGSDRLFLANFRGIIEDEIFPQLSQQIESQLLKDHLSDLSKTITQLSTERNRILHFALNTNPVNPHPYDFALASSEDFKSYPTQAAIQCANSNAVTAQNSITSLKITIEQLNDCPHFKLINMEDKVLSHYAQAVSDLNELHQFQKIIEQTIDLLGQAGEVYTVYQFREQLSSLLKQIEQFIDISSIPIDEIINTNTNAYHKAIHDEQNLSFITKLLTSEKEKLATFIHNQDTLAQFPSSMSDLAKTNNDFKAHVKDILGHLNGPKAKKRSFVDLSGQASELNGLMNSMNKWVKVQFETKGLEPPKEVEKLEFVPQLPSNPGSLELRSSLFHSLHHSKITPLAIEKPLIPGISDKPFNYPIPSPNSQLSCPENQCQMRSQMQLSSSYDSTLLLGMVILIPIGILFFYLLYRSQKQNSSEEKNFGTKQDYMKIKIKLDDLIVTFQRELKYEESTTFIHDTYHEFMNRYKELDVKFNSSQYDVEELQELFHDIDYFIKDSFDQETQNNFIN